MNEKLALTPPSICRMPPKSKKWARKGKKGQKRAREPQDDRGQEWVPNKRPGVILRSPIFEAYYRAQQIVPTEEWKAFMTILKDPLPACFRINLDCDYADV
jgi:multisite-specific tRNA:(cytosine-C5)-methyltransferase